MLNIIYLYSTNKHRLIDKEIKPAALKRGQIPIITAAASFILAIGLSFINPLIGIIIYVFNYNIWNNSQYHLGAYKKF
jgi:hypothetical protein